MTPVTNNTSHFSIPTQKIKFYYKASVNDDIT